jgi:hypothetical protein
MIILINGSLGVGKSSVSEELHHKFDKSVYLDGDYIGYVHPFEIYDQSRIDHLYRTLELLVRFHQKDGYHNFVINYVFESAESLQELIDRLIPLDSAVHTYWLTCAEDEQAGRIRGRGQDQLAWELDRFVELNQIQIAASQQGFIGKQVDTSGLSAAGVAERIWQDIFEDRPNKR